MDFEGKYKVRIARDETTTMPTTERLWYRRHTKIVIGATVLIAAVTSVALGYYALRHAFLNEDPRVAAEEIQIPTMYLAVNAGTVEKLNRQTNLWEHVGTGEKIIYGTTIKTNSDSYATLIGFDDSVLRLGPDTQLELLEIRRDEHGNATYTTKVLYGKVWHYLVAHAKQQFSFTTSTFNTAMTATGENALVFDIETDGNSQTGLATMDGTLTARAFQLAPEGADRAVQDANAKDLSIDIGSGVNVPAQLPATLEPQAQSRDFQNSYWYKWNRDRDRDYQASLENKQNTTGPEIVITKPKNDYHSATQYVDIEGTTAVEATVFLNDHQLDNVGGVFRNRVQLAPGKQVFTVRAVDRNGATSTKELAVYYDVATASTTSGEAAPAVGLTVNQKSNGLAVDWTDFVGRDFREYEILRSMTNLNPNPQEGSYQRIGTISTTEFFDSAVEKGKTYNYRVCVATYSSTTSCSSVVSKKYEPTKPEENQTPVAPTPQTIVLQQPSEDGGELVFTWDAYAGTDFLNYKILATQSDAATLTLETTGVVRWTGTQKTTPTISSAAFVPALTPGNWSVRIAVTKQGSGTTTYSNIVTVAVPE